MTVTRGHDEFDSCGAREFAYSARTVRFEAERNLEAIPERNIRPCGRESAPFPCLCSA